jgi:hypothetical protein
LLAIRSAYGSVALHSAIVLVRPTAPGTLGPAAEPAAEPARIDSAPAAARAKVSGCASERDGQPYSEATRRIPVERGGGAPGVHLGAAGRGQVVARAGVRGAGGAGVRVATGQPASARGHPGRAADRGRVQPLLPAALDRATRALLPVPRRVERVLARGAEVVLQPDPRAPGG